MKINAKENVLLMNKKMGKMGADPAPVPATTVSNPEGGMKALETMGQQNVAFQGKLTTVIADGAKKGAQKAGKIAKNGAMKTGKSAMILATAMMLGMPVITSCTKGTDVSVVSNTEIDLTAFNAIMTQLLATINDLKAEIAALRQEINDSNKKQIELLSAILDVVNDQYTLLQKMSDEQKEHYKNSEEFYKTVLANMVDKNLFLKYLGEDSPLYKQITAILAEVNSGNKTAKAAYDEIIKLLQSIDSKMDILIKQNDEIKNRMDSIITLQVEQNVLTQEQKEAFMKAYDEILKAIKEGNINDKNFYANVYQHWAVDSSQRAMIIQMLAKLGYTQEQALKYLEGLDTKAAKSEEEAKAAFEELMAKLDSIENLLEQLVQYANKFLDSFNKYTKDFASIKQTIEQIRNGININNTTLLALRQDINNLRVQMDQDLKSIKATIEKSTATIVGEMTEGKDEIIAVMKKLGYEEQEIIKMSKEEIVAAIEKNSQYVQNNGAVLSKILSYVAILPEMRDAQVITNTKMDMIINKMDNLEIKVDVEISPEVLAELEAFLEEYFDEISDKLDEINNNITTQGTNITNELKKTNVNLDDLSDDVKEIKDNSAIQAAYLKYILAAIENIDATTTNIEEIAAQIGVDVAWIREHGGGSGSTVDLSKIENYLKQILAEQEATNVKLDLLIALQSKDSDKIDKALEYLKSIDSTTKAILEEEKNFKDIIITEFAAFGIQMDENNEWLEKIYNKKCNCAKDVTIIVQKIYEYLIDGNEGIVDYDKLFDDLFGDEETKATAQVNENSAEMAEKILASDKVIYNANKISKVSNGVYTMGDTKYVVTGDLDKTLSVADFYKAYAETKPAHKETFKEMKQARKFQRATNRQFSTNRTFNA